MNINAILFDCDGTLVDTESTTTRVFLQVLSEIGLILDEDTYSGKFEGTNIHYIFDYVEEQLDQKVDREALQRTYRQRCDQAFSTALEPVPGMLQLVERLTLPFAVASNGPLAKMQVTLPAAGFGDYIPQDRIFSAYDLNAWKPDPTLFLHAAQKLNVSPQQCLVIEDTIHGIQAAVAAGMPVIGINVKHQLEEVDQLVGKRMDDGHALARHLEHIGVLTSPEY